MAGPFTGPASWPVSSDCGAGFLQMPVQYWLLGRALVPSAESGWCPLAVGVSPDNPANALRHRTFHLQPPLRLHTIGALGEGSGGIERRFSAVSASRLFLSNEQS